MDYLARREHSRGELYAKLARKGFSEHCIAATLDGLAADNLQCQQRFAEAFATARLRRGKGPLDIRTGLRRAGIGDSEAERAMAAALNNDGTSWAVLAREVRLRRFGEAPASSLREAGRQTRFLLQRGFTSEQARAAVGDLAFHD